jgi:hypothetical protein
MRSQGGRRRGGRAPAEQRGGAGWAVSAAVDVSAASAHELYVAFEMEERSEYDVDVAERRARATARASGLKESAAAPSLTYTCPCLNYTSPAVFTARSSFESHCNSGSHKQGMQVAARARPVTAFFAKRARLDKAGGASALVLHGAGIDSGAGAGAGSGADGGAGSGADLGHRRWRLRASGELTDAELTKPLDSNCGARKPRRRAARAARAAHTVTPSAPDQPFKVNFLISSSSCYLTALQQRVSFLAVAALCDAIYSLAFRALARP